MVQLLYYRNGLAILVGDCIYLKPNSFKFAFEKKPRKVKCTDSKRRENEELYPEMYRKPKGGFVKVLYINSMEKIEFLSTGKQR
jgi:hypothetical protein